MSSDLVPRFAGCLLGGAAGDALGAAVEFMTLPDIRVRYGPRGIVDFAEIYGRVGAITDDTQMTLFTAEGLIRAAAAHLAGTLDDPLRVIHRAYLRWLHSQAQISDHQDFEDAIDGWLIRIPTLHSRRAPGNTCLSALARAQAGTCDRPINDSKGCGGVMRVAPVGLWGQDPFELGCRVAALTHGHPTGYLAAGVLASIIAYVVGDATIENAVTRTMDEQRPVLNDELKIALDRAIDAAAVGPGSAETVESLGEGWVAEEALAIAIYCSLVADDLVTGVRLAVNHGGDSDSTGSITGNILGAAHGPGSIPEHWLEALELRDEISEIARDLATAHAGLLPDPSRYPPY
jgi:ADP-ribosyl-[dinitrogen reductase] hydrolase